MSEVRLAQYFELITARGAVHRYQNFFVGEPRSLAGIRYDFAPFRAEGSVANLNGDNSIIRVLFPAVEYAIRLVEAGDGNRLSRLTLTTQWLTASLNPQLGRSYAERYVGIGASFSETTVELRFRTAMDSVGSEVPARRFTVANVGILPLNAEILLR